MILPGFSAEVCLDKGSNRPMLALSRTTGESRTTVLTPQLGGPGFEGRTVCISDCTDSGKSLAVCDRICRDSGTTNPRRPCGTEDFLQLQACLGANTAWEAVCVADTANLAAGGLIGLAAAAAAAAGCHALANGFRDDCHTTVGCV